MILLKPIKLLLWFCVLLIVLVLGAGFFADGLAKKGIEAGGTEALGVETTVGGCNVGFFSGTFSLEDLAIANHQSNNISILLNIGNGTFQSAVNYAADYGPYSVFSIDFNAWHRLAILSLHLFINAQPRQLRPEW